MATDSSFQDETQGNVPSSPEPDTDEPMIDPDEPGKKDWKDPSAGDGIPDDEDMPLPND